MLLDSVAVQNTFFFFFEKVSLKTSVNNATPTTFNVQRSKLALSESFN